MSGLPQQIPLVQYVADGVTTTYSYPFEILLTSDIAVYVTLSGNTANPVADLQTLNVDYIVTDAGNVNGGTIVFQSGFIPPALAIITLSRNMQISIDTQFSLAQNFNGANLDAAFDRVVLIMQQLNADLALRALTYVINSYIPNVNSTNLPLLTNQNNQIWISQGGVVVAAELVQNPNVSVLQALLASQVDNADGASLIGYYDQTNNVPQTLAHFLNNLSSYISTVVAGLIPASGFSTGDIKKTLNPTPAAGWILWTNGTIGSAASGASVYANAAASALYTLLWNTYSNTICPVSGGRGANAGADFGANKTLALPNVDYSVLVNQANVASIGAYVPGQNFGEATHLLTTAELPSQTYSASGVAASRLPNLSGPSGVTLAATTNGTPQAGIGIAVAVSDANGGGAHNNIQPSTAVYFVVKL